MSKVKGFYSGKSIRAWLLDKEDDVVRMFEYVEDPGKLYFPLIEDGRNVESDKFVLNIEQINLLEGEE